MLCRPNALPNSAAPARKPSHQLEAPRTLGEIPGTPESHAQNLAHAGMGEFAHSKSLKRSKSTGREGEEEELTAEELEMQPLWQQNGHSDSTGVWLSASALIVHNSLSMPLFVTIIKQGSMQTASQTAQLYALHAKKIFPCQIRQMAGICTTIRSCISQELCFFQAFSDVRRMQQGSRHRCLFNS